MGIKISELEPTANPSRDASVPVAHDGLSPRYTIAQILGLIQAGDIPALAAAGITFDPTGTGLDATDVQAAIEELIADLGTAAFLDASSGSGVLLRADGDGSGLANVKKVVLSTIRVFTASSTWTKPAGLHHVVVKLVGGGAGGGGYGSFQSFEPGGGGGAGGYAEKRIAAANLGATETVTVGAAGTGGASGTGGDNGTAGGTSSFGSHVSCTGGGGGLGAVNGATGGASGGSSGGDFGIDGQRGESADANCAGGGGSTPLGFGGARTRVSQTAAAATGYGSGGCGSPTSAAAAPDGRPGLVLVYEYVET